METHESITENPLDSFLVIRKRKSRFEIEKDVKDIKISTGEDFNSISKIAHAYAKEYSSDPSPLNTFKKIGIQIGNDFQFQDKGAGSKTLAEQIQNNVVENRDCKIPTFLLAVAWDEISNSDTTDIVYLNSNLAHPYVHTTIDGKKVFGHFTKARLDDINPRSQFELLNDEETGELENFMIRNRTTTFSSDLSGMIGMDELFIRI